MSNNFYSPLTFFLAVSLLSFGDPKSLDQNLQSLSFALDSTNRSVERIKNGMDTLNYGIEQIVSPGQGPPTQEEDIPEGGEEEIQGDESTGAIPQE